MATEITAHQFWTCISILLRNYNVVNRKIFGCIISEVHRISRGLELFDRRWHGAEELLDLPSEILIHASAEAELSPNLTGASKIKNNQTQGFLISYKFLTKKAEQPNVEALGIIDFPNATYTCHFYDKNNNSNFDDFRVQYHQGRLLVELFTQRGNVENSERWCNNVLLPKLFKWAQNEERYAAGNVQIKSLQLVDQEEYNNLYKTLKSKHAENVLKFWDAAKESTDPLKFIYEDLAIASYLITLWRSLRAPIVFADLGCGNGLLVYILNEEGYTGYGFDIRARKLWTYYNPKTQSYLIEQTIDPINFKIPNEVNWLIGNHSDELSPWLPILTATTNYEMCFFLLPCCPFELSGAKFQRRNSTISAYNDFYSYAKQLSEACGFKILEDRLKIPSTKRLALISYERTYTKILHECKIKELECFVKQQMQERPNMNTIGEVKLREKAEVVRNCTQIDKSVVDALVQKIFMKLLYCENGEMQEAQVFPKPTKLQWLEGSSLTMQEVVQLLTKDDLKHIKAECGGIKTLLRNKHEIFEFRGKDMIGIRKPQGRRMAANVTYDKGSGNFKKRPCFFKQHHPDGCPLAEDVCTFIH